MVQRVQGPTAAGPVEGPAVDARPDGGAGDGEMFREALAAAQQGLAAGRNRGATVADGCVVPPSPEAEAPTLSSEEEAAAMLQLAATFWAQPADPRTVTPASGGGAEQSAAEPVDQGVRAVGQVQIGPMTGSMIAQSDALVGAPDTGAGATSGPEVAALLAASGQPGTPIGGPALQAGGSTDGSGLNGALLAQDTGLLDGPGFPHQRGVPRQLVLSDAASMGGPAVAATPSATAGPEGIPVAAPATAAVGVPSTTMLAEQAATMFDSQFDTQVEAAILSANDGLTASVASGDDLIQTAPPTAENGQLDTGAGRHGASGGAFPGEGPGEGQGDDAASGPVVRPSDLLAGVAPGEPIEGMSSGLAMVGGPSALNGAGGVSSPGTPATNRTPPPFADQLQQGLELATRRPGQTVQMVLQPEGLGTISLRVGIDQSGVGIQIGVDNPAVRDLVQASWPQLQKSLDQQGLSIQSLLVDLSGGQAWQEGRHETGRESQSSAGAGRRVEPTEAPTIPNTDPRPVAAGGRQRVDYRV
jgi:hypothetical protein